MADTTCKCRNCHEAPPFEGFDECLPCAVAIAIVEDPGYLETAKRIFTDAKHVAWLAKLEAEWVRQSSALPEFAQAVAA